LFTYYLKVDQPAGAKIVLAVTDKSGNVLQRVDGPATAGLHRVNWDLNAPEMVGAGNYRVEVTRVLGGAATPLGGIQEFEVAGW
jgi:flagellar hook assembly protein FlgD